MLEELEEVPLIKRVVSAGKSVFLVLFFVYLALYVTYSIHLEYSFPYHADEWDALAIANEINRIDGLVSYNPFRGWGFDPQAEQNYHLFLATIMNFTNWDEIDLGAVYTALFVPVLMTFLMILFTFLLIKHLTGNSVAAFLSAITVVITRPNVTLLGYWFAVPMAFGLAFMPLVLLLFVKTFTDDKSIPSNQYFLFFLIVYAMLTLTHPATAIIFLPAFFLYFLLNPRLLFSNKLKIGVTIVMLIALMFLMVGYMVYQYKPYGTEDLIEKVIETLSFPTSLYEVQAFYYIPRFLSEPMFWLGVLGLAYLLNLGNRQSKIMPLFIASLLPIVYFGFTEGQSFLAEYRRVFMFAATSIAMLSGVGLYVIYSFSHRVLENVFRKIRLENIITGFLSKAAVLAVILLFLINTITLVVFTHQPYLYRITEAYEMPAFLWLKYNTNNEEIVLAHPWSSRAIHVIAGNRILYANPARLQGARAYQEIFEFFSYPCEERIRMTRGATYVYSNFGPIYCSFLQEVFSNGSTYIYKVAG